MIASGWATSYMFQVGHIILQCTHVMDPSFLRKWTRDARSKLPYIFGWLRIGILARLSWKECKLWRDTDTAVIEESWDVGTVEDESDWDPEVQPWNCFVPALLYYMFQRWMNCQNFVRAFSWYDDICSKSFSAPPWEEVSTSDRRFTHNYFIKLLHISCPIKCTSICQVYGEHFDSNTKNSTSSQ